MHLYNNLLIIGYKLAAAAADVMVVVVALTVILVAMAVSHRSCDIMLQVAVMVVAPQEPVRYVVQVLLESVAILLVVAVVVAMLETLDTAVVRAVAVAVTAVTIVPVAVVLMADGPLLAVIC